MARYKRFKRFRRGYGRARAYVKRKSSGIPGQVFAVGYFLAGMTARLVIRAAAATNLNMAKFETSLGSNIAGIGLPMAAAFLLKGKIKGLTTIALGFSAPALVDIAGDLAGKIKGA